MTAPFSSPRPAFPGPAYEAPGRRPSAAPAFPGHPAPLEALPRDAAGCAGLWRLAAALALAERLDALGEDGAALARAHPFLAAYREAAEQAAPGLAAARWPARLAAWERGADPAPPLARAAGALGLSGAQRLALALAALPGDDSRFAGLFADLQGPAGPRAPTAETLARLLGMDEADAPRALTAPLLAAGLLEPTDPDLQRAERPLRMPDALRDAAQGVTLAGGAGAGSDAGDAPRMTRPGDAPRIEDLIHPRDFLARIARLPAMLAGERADLVILRRMPGADAAEIAAALARGAGLGLLRPGASAAADPVRARRAGALALLSGAALLLERDAAPSETVDLPPALPGGLPTFLGLGREGGIAPDRLSRAVTVEIPFPGPDLRARIWRAALGDRPVTDLPALRDRFQLPHGHIRRLAAAAAGEARLEGRDAIAPDDVRRAARQLGRQELDGLADPLEARGRWDDLVASPAATTLLQELAARARHREALPDRLSERPGRGLRALLTGPSGAGKTLAARIFAAELGMDIHRVDLASVVSKFVGETEKNLARLLARAEALDVVLLIDEGDALLARRTEVKSSNDRFANMETDFLLQRLEFHQGVVLITTNLAESVDPAFQRRMDAVIPFARPGAEARRRIWELHLPEGTDLPPGALERLARSCAMTGGQIRNAVRHAAGRALEEAAPLGERHLRAGVAREYQKAGAMAPLPPDNAEGPDPERGAGGAPRARVSGFAAALGRARRPAGQDGGSRS